MRVGVRVRDRDWVRVEREVVVPGLGLGVAVSGWGGWVRDLVRDLVKWRMFVRGGVRRVTFQSGRGSCGKRGCVGAMVQGA